MNLNVARLFAFTRALEAALVAQEARHDRDLDRLREEFAEERMSLRDQVLQLIKDRDSEREERRHLQDRLLQKIGAPPVYEPSPGEVIAREANKRDPNAVIGGLRVQAQAASAAKRAVQLAAVKEEINKYVKDGQSKSE
jgi:hypothetical protein